MGLEDFLDCGIEIEFWDMCVVVARDLPYQECWQGGGGLCSGTPMAMLRPPIGS